MSGYLLSILIWLPLFAAVVVLFTPRQSVGVIRWFSVLVMLVELGISLLLLTGDYTSAQFQFAERAVLVEKLGITYSLGVDGISLWLVLLTTLLTPLATYSSWTAIHTKVKEYAFSFLLLETGMLGAFIALDVLLFYVFWELMLIPMALIIGIWGGPNRVYAAIKFFLFTMVGSLFMLVAIIYLAVQYQAQTNLYTFELAKLTELVLPVNIQIWLFAAFALAFAVKVPMFPLHTWLPDAHVEAPTGGSVILAAVLLKLGCYGFLRFAMPLFPSASHRFIPTLVVLAIVGIIYGAYCAWVQKDFKKLVAYSSVSHLGFVMLGLFSVTPQGLSGSILQMVNHGISTGALFVLVGVIYERRHTRDLNEFGGLAKVMPNYALIFVVVALSSAGLPGTNGFVGEFMILSGAFLSEFFGERAPLYTLFAATGVVLAAVYLLHAVLKVFFGPADNEKNQHLPDLTARELTVLAPLVLFVFWIGLYPNTFLKSMEPSIKAFTDNYSAKLKAGDDAPTQRAVVKAAVNIFPQTVSETGMNQESEEKKADRDRNQARSDGEVEIFAQVAGGLR
ncbi:MAG: NADH-quinone oxidoreductase subunit M [Deltaproteobacteria bacterium]|nr:NADH-quinone oxidoreductase subunit M [Deltaproteobacteria bacterium]